MVAVTWIQSPILSSGLVGLPVLEKKLSLERRKKVLGAVEKLILVTVFPMFPVIE
jgi:hypothetical protein